MRTATQSCRRLTSAMRPMSPIDWHVALHEHGVACGMAKSLQPQSKNRQLAGTHANTQHVNANIRRPVNINCTAVPTDSLTRQDASQRRPKLHTESEPVPPLSIVHCDSQDTAVQSRSVDVLPNQVCKSTSHKQQFSSTQIPDYTVQTQIDVCHPHMRLISCSLPCALSEPDVAYVGPS